MVGERCVNVTLTTRLLIKFLTQLQGDGINYPRNLELALERRDDPVVTVKLTYHPGKKFEDKNTYTGKVTIGNAEFRLEFSTGSSDLWVGMGNPPSHYPECSGKRAYTIAHNAGVSPHVAQYALKKGPFYPQHGVDRLFQGIHGPSEYSTSRETARRADDVKFGGITVEKYTFGVIQLSRATPYFCRQPYDG